MIGRQVSHYEIVEKLGEGGMGVVYKARDTRLNRFVALKFLPDSIGPDDPMRLRFLQEARAASALDHANICTIHDIEQTDEGQSFIVMSCYEGETLMARMARGPMPIAEAVGVARQIATGLARAHERGIVHRDVKPANVFITRDGTVKILDFGVARLIDETRMTREGTPIGTVRYMSPEQLRGEDVDARADVWAVGVILHEMLTGKPAFAGDHAGVVLQAILYGDTPSSPPLGGSDLPPALAAVIRRALRKDPAERFPDAAALVDALAKVEESLRSTATAPAIRSLRRPLIAVPLTLLVLGLIGVAGWLAFRSNRASWARNQALPQIAEFAQAKKYAEAVALAERAEQYIPDDPALAKLWTDISATIAVESTPSGSVVEIRPYADIDSAWRQVGTTPVSQLRLPRGDYRFRFSRAGSETIERAAQLSSGTVRVQLPADGTVPDGMVLVPKSAEVLMMAAFGLPRELELADYFLQRYEVTNRDFKRFVDAGGYRRKEFWKHEFVRDGRTLSWEEALAEFRDKAGQPGPSTWEVGAYPAGADDLPVGGVSWFEAAAYAEFAGLSLPTIHHWFRAAGIDAGPLLLPMANFGYEGAVAVGRSGAMSPLGTFDMAGNVKEWTSTRSTDGKSYSVGGGWSEPQYMFGDPEPHSPFDRGAQSGFRCVQYIGKDQPDARSSAPWNRVSRNFRAEASVSDETFAQFLRMQQYPSAPLDARIEKTVDSAADIRVERVTFAAAYAGDRVVAYMWLPKHLKGPYQTIVLFPGAEALRPSGEEVLEQPDRYDFLVRSGRAVVHPVYRGMYERFTPRPTDDAIAMRDYMLRWSQDFRRTIDYLETRPDIDASRIAYFGGSLGASFAPIPLAAEPRVRLAILIGGGLTSFKGEPEVEAIHYAPRVKVPLLLLCGRHDLFFPYETSQKPFFERIGTSPEHKRHVLVEAAHSVPRAEYLREMLAWLDQYFGPAR